MYLQTDDQHKKIDDQHKKFDSVYYHVAVNISSKNPTKARYLADSLYVYSVNNKQKVKTLMLIVDILEKQEKRGEAIVKALEALEICKQDEDYVWQSRIYGFLSTQYRAIGFTDKGKFFLKKGVEASSYIVDKKQVLKYKGMSNHELAEYAFDEKKYNKAIEYLELAMISYEKEEDLNFRNFVKANTEELIGRSFMCLGKIKDALIHFSKADLLINKSGSGNSLWAALIYQGLGEVYLKRGNMDDSKVYLRKSLVISENGDNNNLKEKIYCSLSKYYEKVNALDSFVNYSRKYNSILNINSINEKQMINSAYNALQVKPNIGKSNIKGSSFIIIIIITVVLLLYTLYLRPKRFSAVAADNSTLITNDNTNDFVLSEKIEAELTNKIKEFENSNDFLDKNISLPTLIGKLNTNTKYFRQFLKKNKGVDYNTYINELRIRYILNKLETDSAYLTYKISYLADECGFSSHSKFSASFKNVAGCTPSEFIRKIK